MKSNKLLPLLVTPFFLLSSCDFSNKNAFVFKPGPTIRYPIIEAIEYPTNKKRNNEEPFDVIIYLANMYYDKSSGSKDVTFKHGYDGLQSIQVYLSLDENIVFSYDVDLVEYSKQENGIIMSEANKVKICDFKLKYSFDLQRIFSNDINKEISFVVEYLDDATSFKQHGKTFTFSLDKNNDYIKLSNFSYDKFSIK